MYCSVQSIMTYFLNFGKRLFIKKGKDCYKYALHSCSSCVNTVSENKPGNHEISDSSLMDHLPETLLVKLLVGAEHLLCCSLYLCACVCTCMCSFQIFFFCGKIHDIKFTIVIIFRYTIQWY